MKLACLAFAFLVACGGARTEPPAATSQPQSRCDVVAPDLSVVRREIELAEHEHGEWGSPNDPLPVERMLRGYGQLACFAATPNEQRAAQDHVKELCRILYARYRVRGEGCVARPDSR